MTRFSITQRGLSLIELVVALGLSMVMVGTAAYLYLATRESQSKLDQAVDASEVGNFALRLLGREVGNAGFYPTAYAEGALPNVLNVYGNITTHAAYNQGIFGCEGAPFDFSINACGATVAGAPDTLVIAYFTSDVRAGQGGQRDDCEGNDVALGGDNTAPDDRVGSAARASSLIAPQRPLFVANHYTLQSSASTSMMFDGRTVSTRSLLCKGRVSVADTAPVSIIAGLEDLQLLYGESTGPTASSSMKFSPADEVTDWKQVIAVRICVVSKTYQTANAVSSGFQHWQDCEGTTQTAIDHSLRKTYTQIFSVRNHLKTLY